MKVKPEHILGVFPSNPFNRIINDPSLIYLENGALDPGRMASKAEETYFPGKFQPFAEECPYTGQLAITDFIEDKNPKICPTPDHLIYPTKALGLANNLPSYSLGCSVKLKKITVSDPRGTRQVCTLSWVPQYISPMPFTPSWGIAANFDSANGQMIANGPVMAGNVLNNYTRKFCTTVENSDVTFGSDEEEAPKKYCDPSLLIRKWAQTKVPASLFTGKMRMYVQSIYGGLSVKYTLKFDGESASVRIGDEPPEGSHANKRQFAPSGDYGLFTTSTFDYFVIHSGGMFMKMLPNVAGRKLQTYLKLHKDKHTDKEIRALEAYILSTCIPRASVPFKGDRKEPFSNSLKGYPIFFNWKQNWKGTEWARVTFTNAQNGKGMHSTLQKISIELPEEPYAEIEKAEVARKIKSMKDQQKPPWAPPVPQTDPPTEEPPPDPPYNTVYGKFSLNKGQIFTRKDSEDKDLDCYSGDLLNGEWSYHLQKEDPKNPLNDTDKAAKQKELKETIAKWNELPYHKDYYIAVEEIFIITGTDETEGDINTLWQKDKIFTYNELYRMYEWYIMEDGTNNAADHTVINGTAPVYCFYDKKDKLVKIEYTCADADDVPSENFAEAPPCGPGSWTGDSYYFNSGNVSGFTFNGNAVVAGHSGGFSKSTFSGSNGGGIVPPDFDANCRGYIGCETYDSQTVWSPFPGWYRYWEKLTWGPFVHKSSGTSGSAYFSTYLFIPRTDAEAVYMGYIKSQSGDTTTSVSTGKLVVMQEFWNITASGMVERPRPLSDPQVWSDVFDTCGGFGFWWFIGKPKIREFARHSFFGKPGHSNFRPWGPAGLDETLYNGPCKAELPEFIKYGPGTSSTAPTLVQEAKGFLCTKSGRMEELYDLKGDLQSPVDVGPFIDCHAYLKLNYPYAESLGTMTCVSATGGRALAQGVKKNFNWTSLPADADPAVLPGYKTFVGSI